MSNVQVSWLEYFHVKSNPTLFITACWHVQELVLHDLWRIGTFPFDLKFLKFFVTKYLPVEPYEHAPQAIGQPVSIQVSVLLSHAM
jgi:hypothetical protein